MNGDDTLGAAFRAIAESERKQQESIAAFSAKSIPIDSAKMGDLFRELCTPKLPDWRFLSTPDWYSLARSLSLQNSAFEAITRTHIGLGDLVSTAKKGAEWRDGIKEQVELAKQALANSLRPLDLSGISNMVAEMQKVSLASQFLISQFDWGALNAKYSADLSLSVRDSFRTFTSAYDALYRSSDTETNAIAIELPELTGLTTLDYHDTVETLCALGSTKTTPEIDIVRNEVRRAQIVEHGTDIERLLHGLNPNFLSAWHGAIQAWKSGHTDHERHWSGSVRELLMHVIHALAPDELVKSWSNESSDFDNGRPTRRGRMRFICRSLSRKEAFTKFIEKDIQSFIAVMELLNGGQHGMPSTIQSDEIPVLQAKIESMLILVIKMAQTSGERS